MAAYVLTRLLGTSVLTRRARVFTKEHGMFAGVKSLAS